MPFISLEKTNRKPNDDTGVTAAQGGFVPLESEVQALEQPIPRGGFIPMNHAGEAVEQPTTPERSGVLRNVLLNNPLTALGETALNLGTQVVALPVAGLTGLATESARAVGLTDTKGADVVRNVGEALTYQPRGEMGQGLTGIATYPFEKLAEAGQYVGGKTLDATGSPMAATVVDTAINALPMLVGPAAKKARQSFLPKQTTEVGVGAEPAAVSGRAAQHQPVRTGVAPEQAHPDQGFTPLQEATHEPIRVREAGGPAPQRVPDLAQRETLVQRPQQSELQALRGEGGDVVHAMESELQAVPGRRGAQTEPAALAVQDRPSQELRAGERGLDAEGAPDAQASALPERGGAGRAFDDAGGGAIARAQAADTVGATAAPGVPRSARYALIEADDLKASHDVGLRETANYPDNFKREGWNRTDAEQRVQGIVREFEPARLVDGMDDATGAPVVARDGMVEAGNARVIALQRIYQANGQKAVDYRAHLAAQAPHLGLDAQTVATMKKPVLVRLPDEPPQALGMVNQAGYTDTKVQNMATGVRNSWAPGANYVPLVDQHQPVTAKAATVTDLPTPIRREHILNQLASALGTTIYQGRVKGEKRLGFFRPGVQEVRIKKFGDIEVAAHEAAHMIDDRVPAIANAWRSDKALRTELKSISYDQSSVPEGFAEGVRLWMTQPEALEAKAPKVHAWLEDFANTHEYGKAMRTAQEQMTAWFGQDALNRARSKIGTDKPLREYFDGFWDKFRQSITDDLHGVYRMERELTGGKIIPNGPYESARLSRASASIADGAVRFGAPVKQADGSFKFVGKGLEEIMQPLSGALDDSLLYFVGRSSRELMTQGREHLFTNGEIDAMLRLRTPERAQAFEQYQQWNRAILDFAEAQGVINPVSRRLWQRTQYLPFHRVSQPGSLKGKPGDWAGVQALTGGTTNLKDIMGNMLGNAAQLVDLAVKNEARRKIANLSMKEGGGKFMVKIDAEARPVKVSGNQVLDALLKKYGIGIEGDAPAFFEFLTHGQPPAGNNVVAVLQHGKPIWFEVGDPILMRALQAIDRPIQNEVVRWLGLPKRIGQASITATPDFWMANIARDTVMGSVMSRSGFRPIMDSLKGMQLRLSNDPLYRDYLANGGGLSSYFLDERHVRTKLEKFYRDQHIDYRTVLDTPGKVLEFVETMGDSFEMSTRLGEYKRAIDAGENPRHAAYLGREVSSDFAMRGDSKVLGFMTDIIMFLRPALTSMDRLYRGAAHDLNKGAIAAKAGTIALMSAALYLHNRQDARYQDLQDWDRDSYWHFFIGDQHFRYPKIWEIGAMASAAERSVEKIVDGDPQGLGKDFMRILGATFGLNLMPQVIAPLYEQGANRNSFTKAPIETPGMENMQPFMRTKPTTSETLKAAGMATSNLPEALQVNPVRTEALLRGYFNTWAMYGLMLSDKAFFDDKSPTLRTDQLPVVRRFYSSDPPQSTKYETQFYDLLGEAQRLHGSLRELDKIGRQDVADAKEKTPLAHETLPLERAAQNLQAINQDMRKVRRAEAMTPEDKRQRLDQLTVERNDLLKRSVLGAQASMKAPAQ